MKKFLSGSLVAAVAMAGAPALAVEASRVSIEDGGRNIMRTAEGGLVATYAKRSDGRHDLVFSTSIDNGSTWRETLVKSRGEVTQSAIDSNFHGSYIAYVEKENGRTVGRIAFTSAPFAERPSMTVSAAVTPPEVQPHDTFIQASRVGWGDKTAEDRLTVAYGWQDAKTRHLYVGVSLDGRAFPMASKIVADDHAVSGPAVAVRGDYVLVSYLTKNPAIAPRDVPAEQRAGRAYQAWTESTDGGKTWSSPQPLFGHTADGYPTVDVLNGDKSSRPLRLSGGTEGENSPILSWGAQAMKKDESIIFVQSALRPAGSGHNHGEVGIVSFKLGEPGAPWTHVIANDKLADAAAKTVATAKFQYSALVDTPVRATAYSEYDNQTRKSRLVLAVSTDTGKNFTHLKSFTSEELARFGVKNFDAKTVFASSQCLFEDRDGNVHLDMLVHDGGSVSYARVPIGVSAAELRRQEALQMADARR